MAQADVIVRGWVRCEQCAHHWILRTDHLPGICSQCGSREWNASGTQEPGFVQPVDGPHLERCLRCGYLWFPSKAERPRRCSNELCGSIYFDRPRLKESSRARTPSPASAAKRAKVRGARDTRRGPVKEAARA